MRGGRVVEEKKKNLATEDLDLSQLKKRLDMLDERLDNVDSMVSAVIERVINKVITLNVTCPHCGKNIEISIVSNPKARP
jgi:hypothetical protein